jgi:hypothetical protein
MFLVVFIDKWIGSPIYRTLLSRKWRRRESRFGQIKERFQQK